MSFLFWCAFSCHTSKALDFTLGSVCSNKEAGAVGRQRPWSHNRGEHRVCLLLRPGEEQEGDLQQQRQGQKMWDCLHHVTYDTFTMSLMLSSPCDSCYLHHVTHDTFTMSLTLPSPSHSCSKLLSFYRAQIKVTLQNGKILLNRKACCAAQLPWFIFHPSKVGIFHLLYVKAFFSWQGHLPTPPTKNKEMKTFL